MRNIFTFAQIIFFLGISAASFAQPANDDCLGSINVTDDGSCISGTTVAATDNWVDLIGCQGGPGGPSGNHPDVWYSFTATNSSFSTTVTAGAGWAGTIEVTLMEPDALGCGGIFTELASGCAVGTANITTTGLIPGNTYYIIVSNPQNGTPGAFTICTETSAPPVGCTDNDDCNTAAPLVLPTSGAGPICVTDCNTGAAPGLDFAGVNCYDAVGPTVWYEFTTDALHTLLNVTLTSSDFANPEFTIYENSCSPWTIIAGTCTEGSGGTASLVDFQGLAQNTTYLIAISDVNGGSGNFELCIEQFPDNSPCNTNSGITETGSSDPNTPVGGPYSPGEVVSFCYNITDWNTGPSCNYLQGIVPTFGSGWDPSSFDANGMPVDITTPLVTAGTILDPGAGPPPWWNACIGESAGTWSWFSAGVVTYNNIFFTFGVNGAMPDGTPLPGGWFFTSSYNPVAENCNDVATVGGSYGDNNFPFCNNTLDWNVCFNLTVGPQPYCTAGTTDLTVTFQTYADGEIGVWNSLGCVGNIPQTEIAEMQCCPIFDTPAAVAVCDSYTLPTITGSLLTGNEAYYTGPLGTGTQYNASDVINFVDFPSYPITLYIYDATSCGVETSFTLTIGQTPVVSLAPFTPLCIDAGAQVLGGGSPAGGVYSGTGVTDNGNGVDFTFNPLTAGASTHTITYTVTTLPNPPACSAFATNTIQVFALPVLTFAAPNDLCINAGVQPGLGGATPAGGVYSGNGVTDDGNGSTYSFDPIAAGAGVHTITYTYTDANSCTASINQNITVDDAPVISGTLDVCGGLTTTLSGTGTPNATAPWTSSNTAVATVDVNGVVTGVSGGTVTITYTDVNGCIAQETVTVNALPVITLTPDDPNLCDDLDGFITVNGAGTGTVTWSGVAAGSDSPVALPYDITGLGAGGYSVTFTDGTTGCISATANTNLNNPGAPIINPIANYTACEVDYVVPDPLDPTNGITGTNLTGNQAYYTAPGGNLADLLPQGTIITSAMSPMTIYAYDQNGSCDAEITFVVNVNTNPTALISPDPASACQGTAIPLNGTPAGGSGVYSTNTWTGDIAILNASNVVNPTVLAATAPGVYNLTYTATDNNGCVGTDDIQVTINAVPVLSGTQEVCLGLTTTINSTGAPDAVTPWTSSNTAVATVDDFGVVTGVAGGTTIITFLDANGCSNTISVTVNANPIISLTPDDPNTCNASDGFITVGGAGTGVVDWAGDATGTFGPTALPYNITGLTAGNYNVIFTDANGCISNNPATTLNNPNAPVIDPISDTTSCAINFVVPDAATYVTGTFLTGNQEFYDQPGGNIGDLVAAGSVITAAMSPLTLYVYDINGACDAEVSFVVTVNQNPTTVISPVPAELCAGLTLQLNGNPVGGSGVYATHEWTNTGASSLDLTNIVDPTFSNAAAGAYDLTYTVTDDNGCIGTSNIQVTVNPNPTATISPVPAEVCAGIDLQLNGNPAGGSAVYTTHAWTNTGSTSLDFTNIENPLFNDVTAGNYDLTYTVTDDNGCIGTDNITVTVVASPVIDPLGPIVACDSYALPGITGVDLTGNQAYFNDTQANAGTVVTGPITSSTTLYMYDGAAGCSDEVQVDITINALPEVSTITGDGSYCENEVPVDVLVQTAGSPDWTVYYTLDGVAQSATGSVSPINLGNVEGTYVLDSIADLNCSNSATGSVVIFIKPTPSAPLAGTDAEYCSTNDFVDMTATGAGGSMTWYSDDLLTTVFGTGNNIQPTNTVGATSYFVTETIDGCEGPSSEVIITVNDCDITLPTAFTPNNDGNNDFWEILSLDEAYPNNIVYIYNRWGNLIFEHNAQTQGKYNDNKWDGTYNGEPLPVGSYFFVIDFNNEEQESVTGAVSIILD